MPEGPGEVTVPAELTALAETVRTGAFAELAALRPPPLGVGRPSAVLVTFAPTPDGLGVLLIERAADLRRHAGQVAFPGGAVDPQDADHVATALREAQEEVGLDPAGVQVLTELPPLFIPRSGFVVTPVLAWLADPRAVRAADPAEVARVELIPLAALVDPGNRFNVQHPAGQVGAGFDVQQMFVWGFTAAVLDRLLELGGWAQPWDRTVVRALPEPRG